MRSKVRNNKSSKLMRIITMPVRILIKAKDNYVKSMNNFAEPSNYGNFMGLPGVVNRSSSVSSSKSAINYDNEDLRELIRSSSASTLSWSGNNRYNNNNTINNNNTPSSTSTMDTYMILKQLQEMKRPSSGAVPVMKMGSRRVPRSCSVGMRKIDEDTPCDDFVDEQNQLGGTNITEFMYPRSRSHAVARKNFVF